MKEQNAMMWVQVVLGLLVGETVEGIRRPWRVVASLAILVSLAGLIATGWLIDQGSIHGWQTGDWERLDASLFFPWPFVFTLVVALLALLVKRRTSPAVTGQLRDLVASNDMRISYPAALQPTPLMPQEVAAGAHTFQRLAAAEDWLQPRFSRAWFFVAIQFMMPISNLDRALGTRGLFGIPVTSPWFFLLTFFLPLCALVALFTIYSFQVLRRPRINITADEQGLTWWRGERGRRQQIGWHAVRSFSVMVHQGSFSSRTTLLVDGGNRALAWTLSSRSSPDEYDESWQLSRQIVTRSGHMLRDLAPLAMSLVATNASPDRLRAIGAPETLIAGIIATKRRLHRGWFAGGALVVGLIAILFVGIFGMAYPHSNQQQYFAGLVGKIHAGKQLYHNALTADDDNKWLTLPPSVADDQMSLGVVDGAYQMSAPKGKFAEWTIEPSFGDMAVEVTVRLSGPATENSDAGLILHSTPAGTNMVVFRVNPFSGSWSLGHYLDNAANAATSWHTLDEGTSTAVHRGDGAENTLLALVRGDVIVLYINGHFVAAYSAQDHFNDNNYDAPPLLHSGYVGVYDNDGVNVARFNDFTVYAIKSPPSLDYA